MAIDIQTLKSLFPTLSNLSPLSNGGQKWVFTATHPNHGSIVLKLIQPSQDIETTRREILAVQQVQSPRVPSILAQGSVNTPLGDVVWIQEQRILGLTVRQILQSSSMNVREVIRLGLHILEALVRAEEVQIVHRDVKPENIIQDNQRNYWLIDFGIARHLQLESLTATASPWGKLTPGYAPPEQFRNLKSNIDARADLFALGITLYECITGVNPFRTPPPANALDLLRKVETLPLAPLRLNLSSGSSFSDLIDTMTQKRRDHRPSSVKEAYTWIKEICIQENI